MSQNVCLRCLKPIEKPEEQSYGLHRQCFLDWFDLKEPTEFIVERKSAPSEDVKEDRKAESWRSSGFFQGKFKKYSGELGRSAYILKVREDRYPELPDVEYVCNVIGRHLKIPVAEFYVMDWFGSHAFVTKNFIKNHPSNADLKHVHLYLGDRSQYNCERLLDLIEQETKSFNDIETFIHVCLFDALIGNGDRHGANLGFIVTPKGTSLAPIYDNPSVLGVESGEMLRAMFEPRGTIATKETDKPTAKDYVAEFLRLDQRDSVLEFWKRVNLEQIMTVIDQSFCSDLMKEALKKLITRRYEEMKNAIGG